MTAAAPVPVLVLSGTVGAGKTTVLHAASELLQEERLPHLALDVDAVSYCYPRPADDRFGQRLALRNVASVWANAAAAGAEAALLARVVESRGDLEGFRAAVPGADVTLVRLTVPAEVVAARLAAREHGRSRDWHLARAPELAAILDAGAVEDVTVVDDGTRTPRALAEEVLVRAGWRDGRL